MCDFAALLEMYMYGEFVKLMYMVQVQFSDDSNKVPSSLAPNVRATMIYFGSFIFVCFLMIFFSYLVTFSIIIYNCQLQMEEYKFWVLKL